MDYSNLPALAPPPGVLSNFNDPKTLSTSLIAVNAVSLSLMLIIVGIRFYSRASLSHAVGWDDCECPANYSSREELTKSRYVPSGSGESLW